MRALYPILLLLLLISLATSNSDVSITRSFKDAYIIQRMERVDSFIRHSKPRLKRYAIEGSFWGVKDITYRIIRPSVSMSLHELKKLFHRAFTVWEEQTELRFTYKEKGDVHIEISFTTGAHGDGEPFDGRGKILAHAYFPRYGGDLHFDDDELWSIDKYGPGLDLYAVAVHEVGHALGLKHSAEGEAIMAPFYQKYTGENIHLHKDDLAALDRLYGPRGAANKNRPDSTTTSTFIKMFSVTITPLHSISSVIRFPDICKNAELDAITRLPDGKIYAFQGYFLWEIDEWGHVQRNPKRIEDVWGIKGPIDAAMTNEEGNTYIFQNSHYWLFFRTGTVVPGYPREIRKGLIDTPDKIDAAMTWHVDRRPYFFKKNKYWKYSRWGMPRTWPRSIDSLFRGKSPQRVDAGFSYDSNSSFIFSGDKYWKVTGFRYMKVAEDYPRSTADIWFNCDGKTHMEK